MRSLTSGRTPIARASSRSQDRRVSFFLIPWLTILSLLPTIAFAAGKKPPVIPPTPGPGKMVLGLAPVRNVRIEMPDHTPHDFGADFQARLTTMLHNTGKYIVMDVQENTPMHGSQLSDIPQYQWSGSVTPSAIIRVDVEAMNFRTGSRGERMFYGFDERFKTPFNDGNVTHPNEFPLRWFSKDASWFGDTFQTQGDFAINSHTGLDLGDGFGFDILFAFLRVKYALYRSELHLKVRIDQPFVLDTPEKSKTVWIEVNGDGFFYDVSGAYENYSAGISVARRDAMTQVFLKSLDGSMAAIERAVSGLPLVARIDAALPDGIILLGTGPQSDVKPGVLYQDLDSVRNSQLSPIVIQVLQTQRSGSVGELIVGDLSQAKAGTILRQVMAVPQTAISGRVQEFSSTSAIYVPSESLQLPKDIIPQTNLDGLAPLITRLDAFFRSLVDAINLPYRLWRYYLYDQAYRAEADGGRDLELNLNGENWPQQIRLTDSFRRAGEGSSHVPVVAVIDSGVDYNHPVLHHSLWLNEAPGDGMGSGAGGQFDRYGWDFVSGDSRPFDDGYHGTQVSSLVTAVSQAKIMPLKIFNPWGVTSSAAIYSAFTYAVDHGAQIILCAWATPIRSTALEQGVRYARDHGVVVVTAAGDGGQDLGRSGLYPVGFAGKYKNILAVAGLDAQDRLFTAGPRAASYHREWVKIGAPAMDIQVAQPRKEYYRDSSSGFAAAIVAGALAQTWMRDGVDLSRLERTPEMGAELVRRFVEAESESVVWLQLGVAGGRALRVRGN